MSPVPGSSRYTPPAVKDPLAGWDVTNIVVVADDDVAIKSAFDHISDEMTKNLIRGRAKAHRDDAALEVLAAIEARNPAGDNIGEACAKARAAVRLGQVLVIGVVSR